MSNSLEMLGEISPFVGIIGGPVMSAGTLVPAGGPVRIDVTTEEADAPALVAVAEI